MEMSSGCLIGLLVCQFGTYQSKSDDRPGGNLEQRLPALRVSGQYRKLIVAAPLVSNRLRKSETLS